MSNGAAARARCNICRAQLRPVSADRELVNCPDCGSNGRMRALIALLSREIFGVVIALPDFPPMKSVRGIGMSDAPELAQRMAEKFDYVNTFYDRPPYFDVTSAAAPDDDRGHYDFILSAEVMEHVAPPVEDAFASLASALKPDALLVMSTPYSIQQKTIEHFPELHEFALAKLGERIVVVNRRRDGSTQIFEDVTFHGGHGATLEMRIFSQAALEEMLRAAGFSSVYFAADNLPDFGVVIEGPCSLPIAARKGRFRAPAGEIALAYAEERLRLEYLLHSPWTRLGRRLGLLR